MMLPNHLIVAGAAFLLYKDISTQGAWQVDSELIYEWCIVMLGVMLPDIDHPKSTLGSRVKWISYPIYTFFGHRGFTHGLVFVGLIGFLGYHYELTTLYYLAGGIALHLLGDFLTPSGVPLLWPVKTNYRAWLVTSTGGYFEWLYSLTILAVSVYIILRR